MEQKICIAGAGLVGSLLALYLAQKGFDIDIHERRPDMRLAGNTGGRSINLALSERGWRALEDVGVAEQIRKVAIPMKGRMVHHENGEQQFLPYGKEGQAIYSVSRAGLNEKLMELAEATGKVKIFFNQACESIDFNNAEIELHETGTGRKTKKRYNRIFGADGAFSAVRLNMMLKTELFDYSQYFLKHAYKELCIPPSADSGWLIEKNALHIWPRRSFMLIALPNPDGSFTCTLFLPFHGETSFEKLSNDTAIHEFFETWFPDARALMPALIEDFNHNPTSSLVTVKCDPWFFDDKVCLIGDAAHAIVPFFGQGMNAGFEDCQVLNKIMEKHGSDWKTIFREFSLQRKPDGDAIAKLALRNFVEMRDLVADPHFLAKRKLEKEISTRFPRWIPAYSLVTFSHIRYSEALKRILLQEDILEKLILLQDPIGELEKKGLDSFGFYKEDP